MPLGMGGYVQSVVVQGRVYVGGGYAPGRMGTDNDHTVMEYDIDSGIWAKLPRYRALGFAMTVVHNELLLVGGREGGHRSKVLGVWETKKWTHPYPDMPTARSHCSAVVYNHYLVVAGGWSESWDVLSSVEVLDIDNKQWHATTRSTVQLPTGWYSMKTATLGDMVYFMGGGTPESTDMVYSVSLPALISQLIDNSKSSSARDRQIWKEISGLEITDSTSTHHQWVLACSRWEG